jgi:hypothetical protein
VSSQDDKKIEIEEVESQFQKEVEGSERNNNFVIVESEIVHNYFEESEHAKAIERPQTAEGKAEERKKIKRLFKTQNLPGYPNTS